MARSLRSLRGLAVRTASLVALPIVAATAQPTIVTGDNTLFTNAGTGNAANPACALLAETWCARNVRNDGAAGITDRFARSGNGSIEFRGPNGPAGTSKADFEFYFTTPIRLGNLTVLQYDWYRDLAGSTLADAHLHPAIRLVISNETRSGVLVFERVYNAPTQPAAPTDTWTTETIGGRTNLWLSLFGSGICERYDITLASWQTGVTTTCFPTNDNVTINGDWKIIGLSTGIGSGWGPFVGAVDNVGLSYQFMEEPQMRSWNFETNVVPEPSTYALLATGLAGLGAVARRRRRAAQD